MAGIVMIDENLLRMLKRAEEASQHAYCPYSKYIVGSAVLTDDGAIYTGANVENSSYGLTICAERSAIVNAVVNGSKQLVAVTVYTEADTPAIPCGACLQVISEFANDDCMIVCKSKSGILFEATLHDLLPRPFSGPISEPALKVVQS
jgi:cytidine deaminase